MDNYLAHVKTELAEVKVFDFPKNKRDMLNTHLDIIQKMIENHKNKNKNKKIAKKHEQLIEFKTEIETAIAAIDEKHGQESHIQETSPLENGELTLDDLRPPSPPRKTKKRSRSRGGRRKSLHRKK